jgi:hypothetical protein
MKVKNVKSHIGDIRSIQKNMDLLYSRLCTIQREGEFPELGDTLWKFMEAREQMAEFVFSAEQHVHRD